MNEYEMYHLDVLVIALSSRQAGYHAMTNRSYCTRLSEWPIMSRCCGNLLTQ